ncbi:MAG: radical SAM protein [Thermodesulfobacteriota bacterium]
MEPNNYQPELPIIRPPSESRSLLVRVTRGCNWNRCRFCGIYPAMGEPDFSVRELDDICHDIDVTLQRHPRAKTAFLGDADPLAGGLKLVLGVLNHLQKRVQLERITCYARASTLRRLGPEAVKQLAAAGLSRVHLGLESGDLETLTLQRKGQSPEMVAEVAHWLREASIELSVYVLLGLGGRDKWRQHIRATAALLNRIEPDFIRIRRLWLYQRPGYENPLLELVRDGRFIEQNGEGTVHELRLLLEELQPMHSYFACDHANNYVQVAGPLDEAQGEMLAEVDAFLSLPEEQRQHCYQTIGSRI